MFTEDLNNNKNSYKMAGQIARITRNVTTDYISYRLEKNDWTWENGRQGNIPPTQVHLAMRKLGDEFEEKFKARFESMVQQLNITENNAHDTFMAIIQEIFDDGVNWGRIVALFGFAATFSVLCFQKDMPHMVDNVVDWVSNYVDNELRDWMSLNNNWDGFLAFHDGPEGRENGWPNIRTIGQYALAGIGVITLGAFLTQRS